MLIPVEKIPQAATLIEKGKRIVLATGKQGNAHTLIGSHDNAITLSELNGKRYVDIVEDLKIDHTQHGELPVAHGMYQVIIENEFCPFLKQMREVAD